MPSVPAPSLYSSKPPPGAIGVEAEGDIVPSLELRTFGPRMPFTADEMFVLQGLAADYKKHYKQEKEKEFFLDAWTVWFSNFPVPRGIDMDEDEYQWVIAQRKKANYDEAHNNRCPAYYHKTDHNHPPTTTKPTTTTKSTTTTTPTTTKPSTTATPTTKPTTTAPSATTKSTTTKTTSTTKPATTTTTKSTTTTKASSTSTSKTTSTSKSTQYDEDEHYH
ncbi:hypothetical protein NLJ89_g9157 [Agrocybe chaxingu]|uniref:Uncharacterized protein n=1 Tax=Agrocybe chaxingu TaxID=84603 RepID=A0A9W8MTT7_9AGAR|nr:hypothetical protein NLJ89_g9157 [Agrocybe chaxingu]